MSDSRLLTDGTAGRAAAARTTTADGDDLAGLKPDRADSDNLAPYRSTACMYTVSQKKVAHHTLRNIFAQG